jgi:hypothetical protein
MPMRPPTLVAMTRPNRPRCWLQTRLGQIGYDHRWLTELAPETAPSPAPNNR